MALILGNTTDTTLGTVIFSINVGKFEIRAGGRVFTPQNAQIKKRGGGDAVFDVSMEGMRVKEIVIPRRILELKRSALADIRISKDYPLMVKHELGNVYFSISDGCVTAKQGDKIIKITSIENIHGHCAVNVTELNLGHKFLSIPVKVANKLREHLKPKIEAVPCGINELNGKMYYKILPKIPLVPNVKQYFEHFDDEEGDFKGWLTAYPEAMFKAAGVHGVVLQALEAN